MGGADDVEFTASQQLMQEAEDLFKKLAQIQGNDAAKEQFWNVPAAEAQSGHNKDFSVSVYLALLEAFYTSCRGAEGKFTSTGTTVGECKLWAILHMCKFIKEDVLDAYPGFIVFYRRFLA